jgi:hypothetical protein
MVDLEHIFFFEKNIFPYVLFLYCLSAQDNLKSTYSHLIFTESTPLCSPALCTVHFFYSAVWHAVHLKMPSFFSITDWYTVQSALFPAVPVPPERHSVHCTVPSSLQCRVTLSTRYNVLFLQCQVVICTLYNALSLAVLGGTLYAVHFPISYSTELHSVHCAVPFYDSAEWHSVHCTVLSFLQCRVAPILYPVRACVPSFYTRPPIAMRGFYIRG